MRVWVSEREARLDAAGLRKRRRRAREGRVGRRRRMGCALLVAEAGASRYCLPSAAKPILTQIGSHAA